jgi:UDP-glucose 4-epimerase
MAILVTDGAGYIGSIVIDAAKRVTSRDVPYQMEPRRPGDPSRLIASANKAESILGWKPERAELESIIETAWNARYPRD